MAKPVVRKKSPEHAGHIYTIKGLDPGLWEKFLGKAQKEGRTARWVLEHFIIGYVNGTHPINLP